MSTIVINTTYHITPNSTLLFSPLFFSLFAAGSNFSLADTWCSRLVSTGEPPRPSNNYNSSNNYYNSTTYSNSNNYNNNSSTTFTPTLSFGNSVSTSTQASASLSPSPCLVASLTSLECGVGTSGVYPGGYLVDVLWQCTHVVASYPLTITAPTTTATTTTTMPASSGISSSGFISSSTRTTTMTGITPSLPQIDGLHPHQGPLSGGTVVSITGTGLDTITACKFVTRTNLDLAMVSEAVVVPAVAGGGGGGGVVQCVTPAVDVDGMSLFLFFFFLMTSPHISNPYHSLLTIPPLLLPSTCTPSQALFLCTSFTTTPPGYPHRMISPSTSTPCSPRRGWW